MFKNYALLAAAVLIGGSVLAAPSTASAATLNYVSQTPEFINVEYSAIPPRAKYRFVNATTGMLVTQQALPSGTGTTSIAAPALNGAFYIRAVTARGAYLAQTVTFYLNNGAPPAPEEWL